jgi:hypothetical protein
MKTILVDASKTLVIDGKIDEELYNLLETYPNRKIILTNADDEQLVAFGLVNMGLKAKMRCYLLQIF